MQAAAYPVQAVIPESIKTPEATLHLLPVLDTDAASTSLNAKCGVGMSHPDFNVSGCSSCSVSCPGLFPAPLPILKIKRAGPEGEQTSQPMPSAPAAQQHQPFRNSPWLYVRGLADAISEEKVRGHFAAWGSVADVYFTGTEWLERNNCCCVPHLLLPVCSQVMT